MVERVPKRIMEGRSSLGKQLTKDRYYQRAKKNVLVTYVWFFAAGFFGAHRFYLGRWKSALVLMVLIWVLTISSMAAPDTGILFLLIPVIMGIELVLVTFLTKWTNEKIKRDFDREVF